MAQVYISQYARRAGIADIALTASYIPPVISLPGGQNTQIQFNSGGIALSGSPNLTFNYASNPQVLSMTGSIILSGSTFLFGLSSSTAPQVLVYDNISGQVYYTASSAFGGVGSSPGSPLNSIQFNNAGNFGGNANLTFNGTNIVYLTGSMLVSGAISASFGPSTVGFFGTSSWAVSASRATTASFALTSSFAVSSSYASSSPNFANANLEFTNNRKHSTNNYSYFLYSDLVGGNDTPFDGIGVSGSFHYLNSSSNVLGTAAGSTDTYVYIDITTQSIDLSFDANPIVPSSYTFTKNSASFSSSLIVTKSVFFPGLTSASYPSIIVIDTSSGQLYYSTASVGGAAVLINNLLTNITVGGSDSGTSYPTGTLLEDILRDILISYQNPTLTFGTLRLGGTTVFNPSVSTYREVSSSLVFDTAVFSATADNPGGRFAYSSSFTASGATIGNFNYYFGNNVLSTTNNLGVGGSQTINRSTPSSVTFTIQGTHPSSSTLPNITDNAVLEYVYPIFYGMTSASFTSSGQLESDPGITKLITGESNKTLSIQGINKYIYFAYPSSYGDLTNIYDGNGFIVFDPANPNSSFIKYTYNQSGSAYPWGATPYNIYKSRYITTVNPAQNYLFKF